MKFDLKKLDHWSHDHVVGLQGESASGLAKRVSYSRRLGNLNIIEVCREILFEFNNRLNNSFSHSIKK